MYEELGVLESAKLSYVFVQLPSTTERACDEGGDFAITTDLC